MASGCVILFSVAKPSVAFVDKSGKEFSDALSDNTKFSFVAVAMTGSFGSPLSRVLMSVDSNSSSGVLKPLLTFH